ncbi:MAG: hypothetical protein Q8R28_17700 [Dehalococcoidia bacterium]|nr:hypothetical protein [Dehalococcoidia bacterium]
MTRLLVRGYRKLPYAYESIVLPNHLHGIVVLDHNAVEETSRRLVSTGAQRSVRATVKPGTLSFIAASSGRSAPRESGLPAATTSPGSPASMTVLVSADESLTRIREYIAGNPMKWEAGKYYIKGP